MSRADFVHLRVHTAYSLSEGALPIDELVALCRAKDMPAVAITDTDNLFGTLEFSSAAAKAGVQPIVGCQLSITREHGINNGGAGSQSPDADPLVLLVQDETGYRNLLKLIRDAYLGDAEAGDPMVSLATLALHSAGLIALTGGADGPVGRLLQFGQDEAAEVVLEKLEAAFPGRLYVELQRHGLPKERQTEPKFLDIAYARQLPLVATNEAFFSDPSMYEAHDALICVAEGVRISDSDRRRLTPDHGFKSASEMRALFADLPEALDNTLVIAKRCAFMVESRAPILPPYDSGTGRSVEDELRVQARAGLERRLETRVFKAGASEAERADAAEPYRKRLEYELEVIVNMGYPGYFLIVADFIRGAKEHGIPVGPGRGSGAGSVVAWALTITDLDPLRFGLLFERFLNPERISMPDFDVDFCQDRRDEVLHYVQEKYGRDHVAQIITFGKLQARAVLRDVGRVLDMPYGYVDKICKLVPFNPANPPTLDDALKAEPQLRKLAADDPTVEKLIDIARRLEGLYRHASTHAAGVVIGDRPLDELIPLYRDPRSDLPVTGFSMKYVEYAGLVKFDFLGLKTLSVLADAERLVTESGAPISVAVLPLDDKATYEMIGRGETTGVFQLESQGMRDVLRKLRADTFEDIIAVVALYRPGPMDNIPSYIRRKHGEEAPDYLYPTLEGILKETFGIIIYQEQVMQIAQELSGYSLGSADILRRAMGKKIRSEMEKQRERFMSGTLAQGISHPIAESIFDACAKFADYGFNKSHSAPYAFITYQTAYMKANYPAEFMAASLTLETGNTDKIAEFRREAIRLGIVVEAPSINRSGVEFAALDGRIIYSLAAIKGVGAQAVEHLVAARGEKPFRDLADFARRVDPRLINKRVLESLVAAGAFDEIEPDRARVTAGVDRILGMATRTQESATLGQNDFFGGAGDREPLLLPVVDPWLPAEKLQREYAAIGFYLSAHPLDEYRTVLQKLRVQSWAEFSESVRNGATAGRLAATVTGKQERRIRSGNRMGAIQLSDPTGSYEAVVFSEGLSEYRDLLEPGNSVELLVSAEDRPEGINVRIQSVKALDKVMAGLKQIRVYLRDEAPLASVEKHLSGKGDGEVSLILLQDDGRREVEMRLPGRRPVSPQIASAIRSVKGVVQVELV